MAAKLLSRAIFLIVLLAVEGITNAEDICVDASRASSDTLSAIVVRRVRPRLQSESLGSSAAGVVKAQIKVAVAPTDPAIVARHRVVLSSTDGKQLEQEVPAGGGIVTLDEIDPAATISTVVSAEFQPSTGLPPWIKRLDQPATVPGSIVLFHAYVDEMNCFVDRNGLVSRGDYLVCRVSLAGGVGQQRVTRHLFRRVDGQARPETACFAFLTEDAGNEPEFDVEILGRLGASPPRSLGKFDLVELADAGALKAVWNRKRGQAEFWQVGRVR
jgi:hypothetical protein